MKRKKLRLEKTIIANLSSDVMRKLKGGVEAYQQVMASSTTCTDTTCRKTTKLN